MRLELDSYLVEIEKILKEEDQQKLEMILEEYHSYLRSIEITKSNAEIMREHSKNIKVLFETIKEKKEGIKRITLQETKQNTVVNRFSKYE